MRRSTRALLGLVLLLGVVAAYGIGMARSDAAVYRVVAAKPGAGEVGTMDAVHLTFERSVAHRAAERALTFSPAVRGKYTWEGQTVAFRPQPPGFARHTTYRVFVAGTPGPVLTFQTAGDLRVQRRFPDDGETEVATDAVLLLQFNVSVQPLTTRAETPSRPAVTIDPPLNGAGSWLTSSMYRFRPADGWLPSTRYTATVAPDLSGLGGETLDGPTTWSFVTVSPAVADVSPAPNTNQAPTAPTPPGLRPPPGPTAPDLNQAPVTATIRVTFNQAVDKAAAERALSFAPPIPGSPTWTDDRTLVLTPDAPLTPSSRYEGTVAAGIPSANGAASSASPFTWSFVTAGPAGIAATDPPQGSAAASSGSITVTFNTPMDHQSVEDRLSLDPRPADDQLYTFWEPNDARLHVNFPGKPSTDYRLTLAAGAADRFGQVIDADFVLSYRTAPLPPTLTVLGAGRGGVFRAGGAQQVAFATINLEAQDLALYRIDEHTFAGLLDFKTRLSEPPADATLLRRWRQSFPDAGLNRTAVTVVEVNDAPLPPGHYLLWSPAIGRTVAPQFLPFVVTKTHLTLKRSANQLLVWALDYDTGAPLAGTALRVTTIVGDEVGTGFTDADGLATIATPPSPANGPLPEYVVAATREGDASFVTTAWSSVGGIYGYPYLPSLVGSMATDRPIYRPGETVYYQGVVRRDDDGRLSVPEGAIDASLIVADSRGRELVRRPLTVDEFGSFNGDLKLDDQATTGVYFARVERTGQFGAFMFANFQVAEFQPPQFFVGVKPDRDQYVNGDQIDVTATAELFLGAPLPDAAARWRVTAAPYTPSPEGFEGYSFSDPDDRPRRLVLGTRLEGTGRTDLQGRVSFTLPADVSGDATSQTFTIETTVTDADNREVSATAAVRVHKATVYTGVRPRDYVAVAGTPVTADLVTLDVDGRRAGGQALSVRIVERRYLTVKVRDPDGTEHFESQPDDREVETRSVTTDASGEASLTFTPQRGGLYRILPSGRDARGNEFHSAATVYAAGVGFIPWQVTNDTALTLVADKRSYKPGETAHVLVPAPFADAIGLVTLERAGVLSTQVRAFEGNSVVLDVPIDRAHIPNVYLSVTLFKSPSADNPVADFRVGTVNLPVSADELKLNISLTPDRQKLGPRDPVTFTVKTTDAGGNGVPAELSLALVDESVLSLAPQQPQDAFATLYGTKRLGVQTSSASAVSLDAVAQQARALAEQGGKGGGGGGGEDTTRSDFRLTADWQPAFRTDANGDGKLTVTLPDTLTTWRLTARGITRASQAGMAQTKIQTSKPLIVRPVTPRFFTAGDKAELGAIVNNLTDAPLDVMVSLSGDGLTVDGGASRSVRVDPGRQGTVSWTTSTPAEGTLKLRWSATGGAYADAVELTRQVRALATPEVVASSGSVTDSVTEVIRGPDAAGTRPTDVTLNLWPSLTASLPDTVRYLREYPFENAEVTASRLLTALGLARAQGTQADAGDASRWIQRLYAERHADGGWGWWRADATDPSITAYVVLALVSARDAGTPVDDDVLGRAANVLRGVLDATTSPNEQLNPNQRAFFTYALTSADGNEMGRAFSLAERRDSLGPEGKALLALAMARAGLPAGDARLRPLLTDLVSSARISAAGASWDDPVSGPQQLTTATRTTAFALQALARADAQNPVVDNAVRWLMNQRREGRWPSTQESALSVLALGAVAEARGDDGSYTYRVALNDTALKEARVDHAASAPQETVSIAPDALHPGDNPLVISREPANAAGRLYYQLSYRYASSAAGIGALDRGVAVAREFLDPDTDQPLTRVKAGSLVKVRVTVLASATMNYVAVEDYLPAGLEAIDTSLRITTGEVSARLLAEAERQAKLRGATCRVNFNACTNPFRQAEIRDDRVALFARSVPKGVHEYVYFARATTSGAYLMRPTTVSEVYFPDVYGRTDSGTFVVEP